MSSRYSRGSEDWILGLNGPECESLDSAKLTGRHDESLKGTGRGCRCQKMSEPLTGNGLKPTASLFNPSRSQTAPGEWEERFKPDTIHDALTAQNPPKGRPIVLISSAEDSHAKTCQLPENEQDLPVNDQDCSSKQPVSLTLFSQTEDGSSLRMFPDSFPQMEELTSGSFSRRWPTSGFMTAPGECWTADTSECPSEGGEYSSLPGVLEAIVPKRFYLSPKAAAGILRRAKRRGKSLPAALDRALRVLSGHTSPVDGEERNLTDTERMSA